MTLGTTSSAYQHNKHQMDDRPYCQWETNQSHTAPPSEKTPIDLSTQVLSSSSSSILYTSLHCLLLVTSCYCYAFSQCHCLVIYWILLYRYVAAVVIIWNSDDDQDDDNVGLRWRNCRERPYQHDSTASRLLSEVKHVRAWLVLRWGTTLES